MAHGYAVIHGRSLPSSVWSNVREHGAVQSAGKMFPTPRAFEGGPDAKLAEFYSDDELTSDMKRVRQYAQFIGNTSGVEGLHVKFKKSSQERHWSACFSKSLRCMTFNAPVLGKMWFRPENRMNITDLIIHELAHNWSDSHLSDEFHEACTMIGAKLVEAAIATPAIFSLFDGRWT